MSTSDAELARQAVEGSQAAYHTLVSRYASAAVNVATRLVRDRALAEDLAQEAFVRAFARLKTFDPQRRFSAWFFQVLHNVAVDYLRRRRIETTSLDAVETGGHAARSVTDPGPSPEAEAERRALGAALDAALTSLRADYREAVILRYQEGLTVQEVASVLEVPEGTVKTYLHRARKELAALLSAAGWKPTE